MNQLDQIFRISESQHGFWLVNHREIIESDIKDLLNKFGIVKTASILNETGNPIVAKIYRKIKKARG